MRWLLIGMLFIGYNNCYAQTKDTTKSSLEVAQPRVIQVHHIISTNVADLALQKWNLGYEYIPTNHKWRTKAYVFVSNKDKNYGLGLAAYSNWKISKHVEHYIGGQLLGEWIDSFYEDLYLKYRPRGFSIAPRFSTGVAFTVWKRLHLGLEGNIGPGFVVRDNRFKGTYLSVGLGVNVGVKF